ncbi:NAD(+)/NADH kinase [Salidesulfovibrio onnuriiensis]|uniref:NAD(+)/NADH kinase n=1 Tax=Salidesulfovibrio onnuriiensis TaxID=2583823 RepID=UPI0011C7AAD6|nr:NAD(+)/NADH kinase [Salidesulfovibrio onnuriiensis]
MSRPVRKVLLITKPETPEAQNLCGIVADYLKERGVEVLISINRRGRDGYPFEKDGSFDLVVVLGGDGTLIGVARRMRPHGTPLVSINVGRVGFLSHFSPEDWREGLDRILAGDYSVSRRMALDFRVSREGQVIHNGTVVNDLVIGRGSLARLVRLSIVYEGTVVTTLRSDGLIVSTPFGSTAYCISAGGPLVHPDLEAYCITAICPFLGRFSPLVLPTEEHLVIRVEEGGDAKLTEDGQKGFSLDTGDEVEIIRSRNDILMVSEPSSRYFNKLQAKGFLSGR